MAKERTDLLSELEFALYRIQEENKYYDQELYEKHLRSAGENRYLTKDEKDWLSKHGPIKIGYQDNYLAFCATDKTGDLTGALKDYLEAAAKGIENTEVVFTPVAYQTVAEAMEALLSGEIDCMFPANFTTYEAEELGILLSPPLMDSEICAVVKSSAQRGFAHKEQVKVAVNEGNTNYDLFLSDNFPDWETVHYKDTAVCLKAVAKGETDCILISNYRFSNISKLCEKLQLTMVSTDVEMDYSFAMKKGETVLYSIMSRVINVVPKSVTSSALTYVCGCVDE